MKRSKFLSLNWMDLGKALLLLIIVTVLNFAQETLIPTLDLSPEVKILLITGIGYLIKNFLSGNKKE